MSDKIKEEENANFRGLFEIRERERMLSLRLRPETNSDIKTTGGKTINDVGKRTAWKFRRA